jgi:hypothetical protein
VNRLSRILLTFATGLALAGCRDGTSNGTGNDGDSSTIGGGVDSGDFIVGVGSGRLDLGPGDTATVQVSVVRGEGLNDPVYLSVWNGNTGIRTSLQDESLDGDTTNLTVTAESDLAPGAYPLTLVARHDGLLRTARLDVRIPGTAPFTLSAPPYVTLRQASQTTVPITIKYAPGAKGPTQLGLSGQPSGVTGSFAASMLEVAQTSLTLAADPDATPGRYSVDVCGTLDGESYVARMQVTVTTSNDPPDVFIAAVDFGQAVVRDTLTLVRGKDALLRVHVLADRVVSSPTVSVTASAHGEVLGEKNLTPPAFVSPSVNLEDLSRSYTTTLPADWVVDGLHLRVVIDPSDTPSDSERINDQWDRDIAVDRGARLRLTLVPLRIGDRTATVLDFKPTVLAMLPLRDVSITVRPTYRPSSVVG